MNETNTAKRKKLTKVQLEVLEAVAKGESAHRPAPVYHKGGQRAGASWVPGVQLQRASQ